MKDKLIRLIFEILAITKPLSISNTNEKIISTAKPFTFITLYSKFQIILFDNKSNIFTIEANDLPNVKSASVCCFSFLLKGWQFNLKL